MKALRAIPFLLMATLTLAACQASGDDSATPTVARNWSLSRLNGAEAPPRVTMDLSDPGRATGQAPCNRWFATIEGTLPEFRVTGAGVTRMACLDLAAEDAFFAALNSVESGRLDGDRLILEGSGGVMLEFLPIAQ